MSKKRGGTLWIVLALAWPTMLEQMLQVAAQYVDSAMVGRLGAAATASVGATVTINWMVGSTLSALGVGFLAFIAREYGAQRYDNAGKAVAQSVLAALTAGLFFTVVTLSLSPFIPGWMNAQEDIRPVASRYFFIIYTPMLLRAATVVFGTVLRASGDTRTPMRVNLLVNIVNVVLNYLLIYPTRDVSLLGLTVRMPGAGLGVIGAAIGTAAGFAVGGVAMTIALWRHPKISPRGRSLKPDWSILKPCLKVALPAALQRFGTSFGYVAFASLINSLGTISTAAHSIANTAESAFYIPAYGIQTAAATLSGNANGMKDQKYMKSITRTLLILEPSLMAVSGTVLFLLAPRMMAMFTPDAEVIRLGTRVLRMVAVTEPLYGIAVVLEGIFMGVGDTMYAFVCNIAGMWGVRVMGTALLVRVLRYGLTAAWGAMIAHNILLCFLFALHYRSGKWNPMLSGEKF
ncbi:MAG: MATE family efflux transporter [Clostridia bacterium]|nr:MATE family efflux transporter [Clostridia bacterium]